MQKNKQIICSILLIVFSVFTLFLNVPSINKKQQQEFLEQQRIEQIMQKEAVLLANTNYAYVNNGYVINSKQDLKDFRDAVNSGITHSGKIIKLNCSINLSGENWIPIGNTGGKICFAGTFDGQGNSITNLNITSAKSGDTGYNDFTDIGLFGIISNATIKDLVVSVGTITQNRVGRCAGSIVGAMFFKSTIQNCFAMPVNSNSKITTIKADGNIGIGGIVGYAECKDGGTIKYCYNGVNILTENSGVIYAGGILGRGNSISTNSNAYSITINCCINTAEYVDAGFEGAAGSQVYAGGIMGQGSNASNFTARITNCLNEADVKGWSKYSETTLTEETLSYSQNNGEGLRDLSLSKDDAHDVVVNYAKEISSTLTTYNIKVGGIVGTGGGRTTVQSCISMANSVSAPINTVETVVQYFYGRVADNDFEELKKTKSKSIEDPTVTVRPTQKTTTIWGQQRYGDYYDISFESNTRNYAGIGFDISPSNSSNNFYKGYYYSASYNTFEYDMYFRKYNMRAIKDSDKEFLDKDNYEKNPLQGSFSVDSNYVYLSDYATSTAYLLVPIQSTTAYVEGDAFGPVYYYDSGWYKGVVFYDKVTVKTGLFTSKTYTYKTLAKSKKSSKSEVLCEDYLYKENIEIYQNITDNESKHSKIEKTPLSTAFSSLDSTYETCGIIKNSYITYNVDSQNPKAYNITHNYEYDYDSKKGKGMKFKTATGAIILGTHDITDLPQLSPSEAEQTHRVTSGKSDLNEAFKSNTQWVIDVSVSGSTATVKDVRLKWIKWSDSWDDPTK